MRGSVYLSNHVCLSDQTLDQEDGTSHKIHPDFTRQEVF